MTAQTSLNRQPLGVKIIGALVLAGVGALTGYGLANALEGNRDMPWADSLALAMAVALIAIGFLSAITLVRRPGVMPRGCGVLQVLVFVLAGVMFLAPMYASALASPGLVFGGIVVLLAVQTVANVIVWRRADEMLRQVMAETSAMAFWALQTALFLYAAAERLGMVNTISGWGLIGILMAVYLIASIVATARRGIA